MSERNRFSSVGAMHKAQNEYRVLGVPPGDLWDRGTHYARFEALGRLHMAIYRYRVFKKVGHANYHRQQVYRAIAAVQCAACPVLP